MKQSHPAASSPSGTGAQNNPATTPAVDYHVNPVFYAMAVLAVVVAVAAFVWGPVVLTLVALVAVPVIFVIFVALSWPYPTKG